MDVCVVKVMGASPPVASSSSSRLFLGPRRPLARETAARETGRRRRRRRRAIERGFGTEEGGAETTRGVRIDSDLDLDWIRIFSLSRVGAIA